MIKDFENNFELNKYYSKHFSSFLKIFSSNQKSNVDPSFKCSGNFKKHKNRKKTKPRYEEIENESNYKDYSQSILALKEYFHCNITKAEINVMKWKIVHFINNPFDMSFKVIFGPFWQTSNTNISLADTNISSLFINAFFLEKFLKNRTEESKKRTFQLNLEKSIHEIDITLSKSKKVLKLIVNSLQYFVLTFFNLFNKSKKNKYIKLTLNQIFEQFRTQLKLTDFSIIRLTLKSFLNKSFFIRESFESKQKESQVKDVFFNPNDVFYFNRKFQFDFGLIDFRKEFDQLSKDKQKFNTLQVENIMSMPKGNISSFIISRLLCLCDYEGYQS
jgi:hypothetical protein